MAERDGQGSVQVYPCVIYSLSATDNPDSYKLGYRYRVEDIDSDNWYFKDRERMFEQLQIHSMKAIVPAEMEKVRAKRLKRK